MSTRYQPIKLTNEFAARLPEDGSWVPVSSALRGLLDAEEERAAEGAWVRLRPSVSPESIRTVEVGRTTTPDLARNLLHSAELAVPIHSDVLHGAGWFTPGTYAGVSSTPPLVLGNCEGCLLDSFSDLYAASSADGGVGLVPVISKLVRRWGVPAVEAVLQDCPEASGLFCNLAVLELAFPRDGHVAFDNVRVLPGSLLVDYEKSAPAAIDAAYHAAHTLGVIATCPYYCVGWRGGLAPHVVWVAGATPTPAFTPRRSSEDSAKRAPTVVAGLPADPGTGADFVTFYQALCRMIHGDHPQCLSTNGSCPVVNSTPTIPLQPVPDVLPVSAESMKPHRGPWQGLRPGDVLLVEGQLDVTVVEADGNERLALLPIDVHPEAQKLIQQATNKGILVVLPAGNSGEDLDKIGDITLSEQSKRDLGLNGDDPLADTARNDSGALLVSCVNVCLDKDSQRTYVDHFCISSIEESGKLRRIGGYGERVNCFSWGNKVQTVSGSWLDECNDNTASNDNTVNNAICNFDNSNSDTYSGTSAASAIVAAAAAILQAAYRFAMFNKEVLSPHKLRTMLSSNSTTDAVEAGIGVQPDLEWAFEALVVPLLNSRPDRNTKISEDISINLHSEQSIGEIWSEALRRIKDGRPVIDVQRSLIKIANGNIEGLRDLYLQRDGRPFVPDPQWPPRGPGSDGTWRPEPEIPNGGGLLLPDLDTPPWRRNGGLTGPDLEIDLKVTGTGKQSTARPPIL